MTASRDPEAFAMNPATATAMFAPDPRRSRGNRADAARKTSAAGQGAWFGRTRHRGLRRSRRQRSARSESQSRSASNSAPATQLGADELAVRDVDQSRDLADQVLLVLVHLAVGEGHRHIARTSCDFSSSEILVVDQARERVVRAGCRGLGFGQRQQLARFPRSLRPKLRCSACCIAICSRGSSRSPPAPPRSAARRRRGGGVRA